MSLHFQDLCLLKKNNPAWRLLQADHAPLIASFLDKAFMQPNLRLVGEGALITKLDDFLFQLQDSLGEQPFPRSAKTYLDEWSEPNKGWLRKFYPPGCDEAHFDLTPATEKALTWLESLTTPHFAGAESRLLIIFELLRQMVNGVETNVENKINTLLKRKKKIEWEIKAIEAGTIKMMEGSGLKERFLQVQHIARELLADFRIVEHNFRVLDQQMREQIATWSGEKGALLHKIFGAEEAIIASDQGVSFKAFWDFLMSTQAQEELSDLLEKVFAMDALQDLTQDKRLKRIHFDWLEAGEYTQRTIAKLSHQLSRYLDEHHYLDNKRLKEILDKVRIHALAIKDALPKGPFMAIEEPFVSIKMPMERPLFTPPMKMKMHDKVVIGKTNAFIPEALFNQCVVHKELLVKNIQNLLLKKETVSLKEIIDTYPLEYGLTELISYLSIAAHEQQAQFDETEEDTISWSHSAGLEKKVNIPRIIFTRASSYE